MSGENGISGGSPLKRGNRVINEDSQPICSISDGTGGIRSSKKSRPKKNPQRGMGVKQLEELRIREQEKSSTSSPSSAINLPPAHQPSLQPRILERRKSTTPLPFLPPGDPSRLYHPDFDPNPWPSSKFYIPNFYRPTPPHAMENPSMGYDSSDSSSPGWLPPGFLERSLQQYSVVNKTLLPLSSGVNLQIEPPSNQSDSSNFHILSPSPGEERVNKTLSSLSSGVNLQIEPPSNQSYSSNFHIPSPSPDKERMVGMKRPWHVNPECLSGHGSFPRKLPTGSFLRPDNSPAIYGNESTQNHSFQFNQAERRWCYNHQNNNGPKDNGVAADGGFLTLNPSPNPSISKSRHPFPPSHPHGYPESDSVPFQGSVDSSQPHLYNFMPTGPTAGESPDEQREELDGVDLNLSL